MRCRCSISKSRRRGRSVRRAQISSRACGSTWRPLGVRGGRRRPPRSVGSHPGRMFCTFIASPLGTIWKAASESRDKPLHQNGSIDNLYQYCRACTASISVIATASCLPLYWDIGMTCADGLKRLIDKLEFLLALAREKHFGRAAEACGVTQPTLSAGVKQLEDQMGVLLVNRGSRFQGFTPEGQRVLEWARRIVGDTRTMREEVNSLKHGLDRAAAPCCNSDCARDGGSAHHPVPRKTPQCSVHRLLADIYRNSRSARTISRSMPASPM